MNDDEKKQLKEKIVRDSGIANIAAGQGSFFKICNTYHMLTPNQDFQRILKEEAYAMQKKASELNLAASPETMSAGTLTPEQKTAEAWEANCRSISSTIGEIKGARLESEYASILSLGEALKEFENEFSMLSNATPPATAEMFKDGLEPIVKNKLMRHADSIQKSSDLIGKLGEIEKKIKDYTAWINSLSSKNLKWWRPATHLGGKNYPEEINQLAKLFSERLRVVNEIDIESAKNKIQRDIAAIAAALEQNDPKAGIPNPLARLRQDFGPHPANGWSKVDLRNPNVRTAVFLKAWELKNIEDSQKTAAEIIEKIEKLSIIIRNSAYG